MDCERHPGQNAIGRCLECGKGICTQCVTETGQVLVCPECFQKEIDRIASAMEMAPGKAPRTRKEKPLKVRQPKKGELPVAPEVPPPAFIQQQPVTPLLDAIPAEVQPSPPVEAPPVYTPPPEAAVVPPSVPPVEQVPVKPKGKAKKEKPPKVEKERPPRVKRKRPPKERKEKPPKVKKEMPTRVKKEKPPKAIKVKKGEMTAPPPVFKPPPTGVPFEEGAPPVEGSLPPEFDEGGGMMEQIRPENVTGEEYLPSPEHQEIMGEPRQGVGAPWEDTGEAAPVEQISEVTVIPGEEAEVPKEDWPVEEGSAPETFEKPTPPPPAPPPFEGPAQAEPIEPSVEEVVGVPGDEDWGMKVDETESPEQPPGRQVGNEEELKSFFFDDESDKEGKDQKGDDESFWE